MSFAKQSSEIAELLEPIQMQDSDITEIFLEAPGAYGILSHGDATCVNAHETASALASGSSTKIGTAS